MPTIDGLGFEPTGTEPIAAEPYWSDFSVNLQLVLFVIRQLVEVGYMIEVDPR